MSERTPALSSINGAGKPRLIIQTGPFCRNEGPCAYSSGGVVVGGGTPLSATIEAGRRLAAYVEVAPAAPKLTYGKVIDADASSGTIAIDNWTNGVPACIPGAPSFITGGTGNVDIGSHRYAITFIVDGYETPTGLSSDAAVISGRPGTVTLANIPVRDSGLNGVCTARRIYRTASGDTAFRLLATIADNTTTGFTDNIADSSLGAPAGEGTAPGFVIDGWIADLPRCQEMTETFEPYTLIHNLYRGNKQAKFFGWQYRIQLDYGKYLSADALHDLRRQLNAAPEGSLILIPRRDAPQFQYNVYYNEPLSIARYGRSAGYRKAVLQFAAMELVASFPAMDGYGTGYAGAYGMQL